MKDFELLDSGDLKVTVAEAKNYESFNAKCSYIAANPLGLVNSVGLIIRFIEAREGGPVDLLFTNVKWGKQKKLVDLKTPTTRLQSV